jgi:ribosomal-protein-alanine N-acetyltransferase
MDKKYFPVLHSERLRFDALVASDKDQLFDIFSDPKVVKHYDVERFKEAGEASRLIEYFTARFESNTGIRWAIRNKDTLEFLGSCGYTHWNEYDYSAVIGYELAAKHWGKGYANEAIARITNFIFADDFNFYVNRVEALILPSNVPSEKVAKKNGFRFEGTLRGKCYWNDDFHDMNMFSLIRKDWITAKKP